MSFKLSISTLLLVFMTGSVHAQHADVRPYVSSDQIYTNGWDDDASQEFPGMRVFGYDFGEESGDPFFAQDPGFNTAVGSGLPSGSQLVFNIPGAVGFGLPSNLSYWDGTDEVEFVTPPSGETLRFNLGSQNLTVGSSSAFQSGYSLGTVDVDELIHEHLNAFLQGSDGNSDPAGIDGIEPAAGIYLVPMSLHSSDGSIADSLPFFIVYNSGLSEEQHDEAIDWVQANLVPEPASLALAAIGGAVVLIVRVRRRQACC